MITVDDFTEEYIFSDEFMEEIQDAARCARQEALDNGHPVVFRDEAGRIVQEMPGGRLYEMCRASSDPKETKLEIVRELPRAAA